MIAASLALLGTTAPAHAASSEVVLPGPATVLSVGLKTGGVHDDLKGVVCQAPNTCRPVSYPRFFYPAGADPLNESIRETDGLKIVYGYSQGGQVISAWMRKYAAAADAPPADELTFVILGNGDRPHGGSNAQSGYATPVTQYKVIDVARQYDFAADFPDDPMNLLALANAFAGFTSLHLEYEDVDLYDPRNIVWTEGNTTYVFVPTENLPLLNPLRAFGFTKLADRLNGPLKEIVERAYKRDYLPRPIVQEAADKTLPPAAEAQAAPTEDDTDVAEPATQSARPSREQPADVAEPDSVETEPVADKGAAVDEEDDLAEEDLAAEEESEVTESDSTTQESADSGDADERQSSSTDSTGDDSGADDSSAGDT